MAKKRSNKAEHWIECGKIGRAIGLKGECSVRWNNDDCPLDVGEKVFLDVEKSEKYKPYKISALRKQGRLSVVRFKGVDDRTEAANFTGSHIYITESQLGELPVDHYYSYQILGAEVFTEDGIGIGTVVKIFTAGDNDVYEVMPDGGKVGDEILIPAIKHVVREMDIKKKRMVIRPMEGMLK